MVRRGEIHRRTNETDIFLELELNSHKESKISSGVPFFDHMLSHIAKHGVVYLKLNAIGDLEVDGHHTIEDIGISFGQVLTKALGDKIGVNRYGHFTLPMEEALCSVAMDICNRPVLVFNTPLTHGKIGEFDVELVKEFFSALSRSAGISLHINVAYGENLHHIAEGIFKAFGHALKMAIGIDPNSTGVLSTKGVL